MPAAFRVVAVVSAAVSSPWATSETRAAVRRSLATSPSEGEPRSGRQDVPWFAYGGLVVVLGRNRAVQVQRAALDEPGAVGDREVVSSAVIVASPQAILEARSAFMPHSVHCQETARAGGKLARCRVTGESAEADLHVLGSISNAHGLHALRTVNEL